MFILFLGVEPQHAGEKCGAGKKMIIIIPSRRPLPLYLGVETDPDAPRFKRKSIDCAEEEKVGSEEEKEKEGGGVRMGGGGGLGRAREVVRERERERKKWAPRMESDMNYGG